MKIIRACYSPLLDLAQAISGNIYKKMLLIKSFPAQKVMVTSEPSLTSRVVSIIKCPSADPATHSILMIDHPGFQLVNAHNEYLNGNVLPVVTWTGGKPPYRFWVSYRPIGGTPDDNVLGTKIVNLAPEFLKATIGPDIWTMEGIITKHPDYYDDGWWADDGNGDNPQDEIGVVIEDSSDTPMQIFVPFTPLSTDPNYNKYTGTGHSYGPDTFCPCPFEFILSSPITYGEDITWLSEPRGRIPGTNTEVEGTFGVYLDSACTIAADLTLPNAGAYSLFVQFVPSDTTHLKTNVKTQTVVVNKATQGPLSVNFYTLYAIDNFYEIVGEIGFYQILDSHPTSGNRVLMFVDPAQNAVMSFNGVAQPNQTIIVNGSVYYDYPNNPAVYYSNTTFSNLFGITETYTSTGVTTFTIYQEGSTNYEASISLTFTQTIYPVGFIYRHEGLGGGVGGGTTETVNFYPDKHVCDGGGVGGGTTKTIQHKTHYCVGGGVGGGTTVTTLSKQNQIIDDFILHDGYAGNVEVTLEELATRNTLQFIYIIASCTSDLQVDLTMLPNADSGIGLAGYYPDGLVYPGMNYDYAVTVFALWYTYGPIDITANQNGNAYWNAAPEKYLTINSSPKEVLTVVLITWPGEYFTVDNHNANCQFVLSRDVLCDVTTSSSNMVVAGRSLSTYDAYHKCTYVNFVCSVAGSYTATFSVTNNPLYADFSFTITMTVPGAPAKQLNSVTGFPTYFIFNPAMNSPNSIGNIRLASMGSLVSNYTSFNAVTGYPANKVRKVTIGQPATFTLGSTPIFGGSYVYTYATVYMSAFNAGCTLRIEHPGDTQYYPFDATWDLTPTGAKIRRPPVDPPPETGPSWHITRYQCSNPDLSYYINGNYYWGTYRKVHPNGLIAVTYGIISWYWIDVPPYTPVPYYGSFSPDSTGHGPAQVHAACVKYGISETQANIAFFYEYLSYVSSSGHFSEAFLYSTIHVISIEEYY